MRTIKLIPVALATWISPVYRVIVGIAVFLLTFILIAQPPPPIEFKIMKTGPGSGTVTSTGATGGINCGGDCDETFTGPAVVELLAAAEPGSTFLRWEGGATGILNPLTVTVNANVAVRAVFELNTLIPEITDFTPEGIRDYLAANPEVNTPARFVKALPTEYRQNWILMTRSESLQTGTAQFPRILLPSADARFVFTIGMATHSSYPGSHPDAIEFMQWDAAEKNFRFHEIVLAPILTGPVPRPLRTVSIDDSKCSKCHSTQNVLNRSSFPGTTGRPPAIPPFEISKSKNKPNWDAYDSWGGMMPFNRDRIYQGSVEAAAFRHIFNLWNWRNSDLNDATRQIIEQLQLQPSYVAATSPHSITRDINNTTNDGHIRFGFDPLGTLPTIAASTTHSFGGPAEPASTVNQGGRYVTLRHSDSPPSPLDINDDYSRPALDEGRGVQLFDLLGGLDGNLNQQRVADELISHGFATGSIPIDIRPIVLAITKSNFGDDPGPLRINSTTALVESVSGPALLNTTAFAFFNARNGMNINELISDTRARVESLPRRKADIQKINLDRTGDIYLSAPENGLMQQYGIPVLTSIPGIRQEVFRRPRDLGRAAVTINGGVYVDREAYEFNIERVALYRYFLEPLGVSVDKWSMGVRGRSRTYSFADIFPTYIDVFAGELAATLFNPMDPRYRPIPGLTDPNDDAQLINAVNLTLSSLPAVEAMPTYTDVQRIFNKSCIECHGGLNYPPYSDYLPIDPSYALDFSEDENPAGPSRRLDRSHQRAMDVTTTDPATSTLYRRLLVTAEDCPYGMMPCGGPALSKTDIETIRRWIVGPPSRPYSNGDPHIRTVDGVNYDFQAAGEFVLLRGETMEIQARHTAVETSSPVGPDVHTGLTSCVSLNSAVALRIGNNRITYQPNLNGKPDPAGLQLRVDGELRQISAQGIPLSSGGRIIQTTAPGGIQVEAPGGAVIIVTPGWWERYQVWYLNIDMRHVRATEGLMGAIAPGNWLPALPDGSFIGSRPRDLNQRYKDLYGVFGNAWRVNDSTTLFDYAAGTSANTFIVDGWPGGESPQSCLLPLPPGSIKPLPPLARAVAERVCGEIIDGDRRANCIQDVMATGDSGFAKTYRQADKIDRNSVPNAPVLLFPKDFNVEVSSPVKFSWNKTTDEDGDTLIYKFYVWPVGEKPDNNQATLVSTQAGKWGGDYRCALITGLFGLLLFALLFFLGLRNKPILLALIGIAIIAATICAYFFCGDRSTISKMVSGLDSGKAYFWKVIVEDGKGGTVESETRRLQVK